VIAPVVSRPAVSTPGLGLLSEHFVGVARKVLTRTDTTGGRSNQHEISATIPIRQLFANMASGAKIDARFVALSDETDPIIESGQLTLYDGRRNKSRPSEYRLYYPAGISSMQGARAGDVMYIARKASGQSVVVVAPSGSSSDAQLAWLFRIEASATRTTTNTALEQIEVDLSGSPLLESMGEVVEPVVPDRWISELTQRFGQHFPTSREFGAFARESINGFDPVVDPDGTLLAWLSQEEMLFRVFEKHLASERLASTIIGGTIDVDKFLEVSLSFHNRRKSRAGRSLENHVTELLRCAELKHTYNPRTENGSRPDFVFPGIDMYFDQSFAVERLTVLGVKTTCKDRWRQVLNEAGRVRTKYLLTLESPISKQQTQEMTESNVQLVVPAALHAAYSSKQREWLMTVGQFLEVARSREDA
jgi:hypothetical protein